MAKATNAYPLKKFHFQVDWAGARLGFTQICGLNFETDVIEYREGNSKTLNKIKLPGLVKYSNVVLKRGVFLNDFDFFAWWQSTILLSGFRRDVTIQLLDEEHKPVISWRLRNAWPCRLSYDCLNAETSEILIESLELAHEELIMGA
jgi:phage tail-like protein